MTLNKDLENIQKINTYYKQGVDYQNQGKMVEAFDVWHRALKLDKELVPDSKSLFAKDINRLMADEYYIRGEGEYKAGNFMQAYNYWDRSAKLESSHQKSQDGLIKLRNKAISLYREGYMLEHADKLVA